MNKKQFKQLQAKWDQKLAKTGFKDIEDRDSQMFTDWDYSDFTYQEGKEEHYRLAAQYLHVGKFPTAKHRKAWELYSQGATQAEIGKRLKLSGAREGRRLAQVYIESMLKSFEEWCAAR